MGKTKLCTKLCREYHSVYICCRKYGATGEPKRSYIADYFLSLVSIVDFMYFYCAFFEVYLDRMIRSNSSEDSFREEFYWQNMEDGPDMKEFWDNVRNKCQFYRETSNVSKVTGKGINEVRMESRRGGPHGIRARVKVQRE